MKSPPPPYSEKSNDKKPSIQSSYSPPRRTKREELWWLTRQPTFGVSHKKVAHWHCGILIGIGLTFLWLSSSIPNYLEATDDKLWDREAVRRFLGYIGTAPLPFAISGVLAFCANWPNLLVPTAVFYSITMMFAVAPLATFSMMILDGILNAEIEDVIWAGAWMVPVIALYAYLIHGYGIMMRVRNDMRDDYLDANPHLIPDSEPQSELLTEAE